MTVLKIKIQMLFYKKFNPEITSDVKIFSFLQMLFTIGVSGYILTFLSKHQYSEVVFFGLIILALSTLTGYLMQAKTKAYRLILFFSFFTIVGIYYFEFLNFDINDKHVLILGSGGSAQTAQYTLSENIRFT